MSLIPNVSPELFSFSAVAVGYLLIDDATANEQNALGNWLMLTAQVLCTNAYYQQVQAERNGQNSSNNTNNTNNTNYQNASTFTDSKNQEVLILLTKMVNAMQKEIDEIKKSI